MIKRISMAAGATCFALSSTFALAFEEAGDAIEYRKAVFSLVATHFGAMGDMVKGKKDFDGEEFEYRAESLEALSKMPLEGFTFPGSEKGETKAKPEVWSDMDSFKAKLKQFQEDADNLADVADSKSLDKIKPVFLQTAKNCKSCHNDFKNR